MSRLNQQRRGTFHLSWVEARRAAFLTSDAEHRRTAVCPVQNARAGANGPTAGSVWHHKCCSGLWETLNWPVWTAFVICVYKTLVFRHFWWPRHTCSDREKKCCSSMLKHSKLFSWVWQHSASPSCGVTHWAGISPVPWKARHQWQQDDVCMYSVDACNGLSLNYKQSSTPHATRLWRGVHRARADTGNWRWQQSAGKAVTVSWNQTVILHLRVSLRGAGDPPTCEVLKVEKVQLHPKF